MAAFKIMIVEDEAIFADRLELLVEELGYEHLVTVDNSMAALAQMFTQPPDLILMDINIAGEMDGIQLAEKINEKQVTPIIFITSFRDKETFDRALTTGPIAFLLKPFDELQLQRSIELAVQQLAAPEQQTESKEWINDFVAGNFLFIKVRSKLVKVYVPDVYYGEADGQYSTLHTKDRKFVIRIGLGDLLGHFPTEQFLQTHRSYFVNLSRVEEVDLQDSVLSLGNYQVPISRRFKEHLVKRLPSL